MVRNASKERAGPPPTTIGDHIRTVRRERGLLQRHVAELIGVAMATVVNWEKNKTEPLVALMPAVLRFLGYDPLPVPTTLGERMAAFRRRHGLSLKEAALRAGVDEESWAKSERTGTTSTKRYRFLIDDFLGPDEPEVTQSGLQ